MVSCYCNCTLSNLIVTKFLNTGAPVGYAYFDIFSHTGGRSNKVRMVSPTIYKGIADHMCFSFWFSAFGAGDTTSLKIYRQDFRGGEDNENHDDDDDSPTVCKANKFKPFKIKRTIGVAEGS